MTPSLHSDAAELRRAHQRGLAVLGLGVVLGLVTFGWLAGWGGAGQIVLLQTAQVPKVMSVALMGPNGRSGSALPPPRELLVERNDNRGQVLFGRYCDSCHPAGRENLGPSLRSAQFKRAYSSPEKVVDLVRKGGFEMPGYPPGVLSEVEVREVAAYILSLTEVSR